MTAAPLLMGIVNATPDSFSDGGRFLDPRAAVAHGLRLAEEGAAILDIGGESTRPGAEPVDLDEERARTIPVIEGLKGKTQARLSIDTRKPEVARAAVAAGASVWNDVTALSYAPESLAVAASLDCDIVLMHARGDPRTMQDDPRYDDVVLDVYDALRDRIGRAVAAGIHADRIVIDPGIGFGKTVEHNVALLADLEALVETGYAVMLGASRKRFLESLSHVPVAADERLGGSLACVARAIDAGVHVVRVHDIAATRQFIDIHRAFHKSGDRA